MKVPVEMHKNLITSEVKFIYAEVPNKAVTDIFQRMYEEHLQKKGSEKYGQSCIPGTE